MSLTVKETSGGGASAIEAGTYPARCVGVVDLGIQHNDFNGKDQEKVILIFELPTERITVDGEDKPRWLSRQYTASLHEKSTLRQHLDAWRGKAFTPAELAGFDLRNVINAPCMLTITNTEKNGKKYADIKAVSKPMKGMVVAELENDPILFDMEADDALAVFETLPAWMKDIVERSPTWELRKSDGTGAETEVSEEEGDEKELPF